MIKQLITAATAAVGLGLGAIAGTVGADSPTEFTDTVAFQDLNPCSQQVHGVTITFHIREHVHSNNVVAVIESATTTSEGHLGNGTQTLVVTRNGHLRTTFNDMVEHPTTREKFSVKGHMRIDTTTGEVLQDNFRMRCIRPAD